MLTISQLKPLVDLIMEVNANAIGDGCNAPCVIADGAQLQQVADIVAKLKQDLFLAPTENVNLLKDAGLTFGECVSAFGEGAGP